MLSITIIQSKIDAFLKNNDDEDAWRLHCLNQKEFKKTVFVAAIAKNHEGKINPHQRRIKKYILEDFGLELLRHLEQIQKMESFKDLLEFIKSKKIKGIGELTCYDTADRIAYALGLSPEMIYLHAGTKTGAENVLQRKLNKKDISINELPEPFHVLSARQIENILCIYFKNKSKSICNTSSC